MNNFYKLYVYRQAKKLYFQAVKLAKKQSKTFSNDQKTLIKSEFQNFENSLLNFDVSKEKLIQFKNFKKNYLDLKGSKKWIHFTYTTILALAAALVIRQMWFELYKVPTGSMRPTIKELDHLTVSKLNFSLNIPFKPDHFYFDPNLVKRSSICVFTSENMDVSDSDTKYFWIIPGKKLLVKRLIAKPGDTIYFYGGKIYGIDNEGKDISSELNPSNISMIDHIPFIQWLGDKDISFDSQKGTIYHANYPYVSFDKSGSYQFVIPQELRSSNLIETSNMSAYWGLDNFAQARLLNTQTKKKLYPQDSSVSSKGLFLELKHHLHPVNGPCSLQSIPLTCEVSLLPLDDRLAKKLFASLYTARFEVKNGALRRYGSSLAFSSKQLPKLHHIPDGTYEFYYGKAYQIFMGGISKELDSSHPIYRFSQTSLEVFFNLGIEFNNYFVPGVYEGWAPPRYSYFRDGFLYVMGMPLLAPDDPALMSFINQETSNQNQAYNFIDRNNPIKEDGSIDKDLILNLGLKIPESMYFVLGDNHAQSADSRVFGFVPQENLKGCPDIIFWPFGSRFGHLPQAAMELLNMPRAIVWSIAWIIGIVWLKHRKKQEKLPQQLNFLGD
jgi:signal peptidase I